MAEPRAYLRNPIQRPRPPESFAHIFGEAADTPPAPALDPTRHLRRPIQRHRSLFHDILGERPAVPTPSPLDDQDLRSRLRPPAPPPLPSLDPLDDPHKPIRRPRPPHSFASSFGEAASPPPVPSPESWEDLRRLVEQPAATSPPPARRYPRGERPPPNPETSTLRVAPQHHSLAPVDHALTMRVARAIIEEGRFSSADLLVTCVLVCGAVPFCHAAAEAFLDGHFKKAALGFGIGLLAAVLAGMFHRCKGLIFTLLENAVGTIRTVWTRRVRKLGAQVSELKTRFRSLVQLLDE